MEKDPQCRAQAGFHPRKGQKVGVVCARTQHRSSWPAVRIDHLPGPSNSIFLWTVSPELWLLCRRDSTKWPYKHRNVLCHHHCVVQSTWGHDLIWRGGSGDQYVQSSKWQQKDRQRPDVCAQAWWWGIVCPNSPKSQARPDCCWQVQETHLPTIWQVARASCPSHKSTHHGKPGLWLPGSELRQPLACHLLRFLWPKWSPLGWVWTWAGSAHPWQCIWLGTWWCHPTHGGWHFGNPTPTKLDLHWKLASESSSRESLEHFEQQPHLWLPVQSVPTWSGRLGAYHLPWRSRQGCQCHWA